MTGAEETEVIYRHLKKYLNHPYVSRFLPKPVIDRDKVVVYYYLFQRRAAPGRVSAYVQSAMAAEIGLSTHETMTTDKLVNMRETKIRQLTALSGDYYSTLYYYTLAREADIEVVEWIAEAIESFNLNKCRLFYPKGEMDWVSAIELIRAVESGLVTKVAEKIGLSGWSPMLSDFFLVKRLLHEQNIRSEGRPHPFLSTRLIHGLSDQSEAFKTRLDEEIRETVERFFEHIKEEESGTGIPFRLTAYLSDKMRAFDRWKVGEG
ncbi:hypothetical protein EWH99_06330 [Sporolactobacillus sp. THM7-7]|nr:hypothetical protein EWH99_06330 [Sporolactobacillus sp. THM7-7]